MSPAGVTERSSAGVPLEPLDGMLIPGHGRRMSGLRSPAGTHEAPGPWAPSLDRWSLGRDVRIR